MPIVRDDLTVEQNIAKFLQNLSKELIARNCTITNETLLAATPAVVEYYLKGQ